MRLLNAACVACSYRNGPCNQMPIAVGDLFQREACLQYLIVYALAKVCPGKFHSQNVPAQKRSKFKEIKVRHIAKDQYHP